MTVSEWTEIFRAEWDEAVARLKKVSDDEKAMEYVEGLVKYCKKQRSCKGCVIRDFCQKRGGRKDVRKRS